MKFDSFQFPCKISNMTKQELKCYKIFCSNRISNNHIRLEVVQNLYKQLAPKKNKKVDLIFHDYVSGLASDTAKTYNYILKINNELKKMN